MLPHPPSSRPPLVGYSGLLAGHVAKRRKLANRDVQDGDMRPPRYETGEKALSMTQAKASSSAVFANTPNSR